ncbi:MAG: hypothetical protein LBP85_07425 [Prevotellaceae bacterium]|jgi:hypothetical protein|nr:hypothetical protein [Prevotellaceae bacterium]
MNKTQKNNFVFVITEEDLQYEAMKKTGRKLTKEEVVIAKEGLECGIGGITLDITYNTIFTEMIRK